VNIPYRQVTTPEEVVYEEKKCVELGWQYRQLATGHDAPIIAINELTKLLLEFI
jgi:hypothetical protein